MTTSILDKARALIRAIEINKSADGTIDIRHIRENLKDLKQWVKEGKLEERITN